MMIGGGNDVDDVLATLIGPLEGSAQALNANAINRIRARVMLDLNAKPRCRTAGAASQPQDRRIRKGGRVPIW